MTCLSSNPVTQLLKHSPQHLGLLLSDLCHVHLGQLLSSSHRGSLASSYPAHLCPQLSCHVPSYLDTNLCGHIQSCLQGCLHTSLTSYIKPNLGYSFLNSRSYFHSCGCFRIFHSRLGSSKFTSFSSCNL